MWSCDAPLRAGTRAGRTVGGSRFVRSEYPCKPCKRSARQDRVELKIPVQPHDEQDIPRFNREAIMPDPPIASVPFIDDVQPVFLDEEARQPVHDGRKSSAW